MIVIILMIQRQISKIVVGQQLDANHTFVDNNPLYANYRTLINYDNANIANIANNSGNKSLYNIAMYGNKTC